MSSQALKATVQQSVRMASQVVILEKNNFFNILETELLQPKLKNEMQTIATTMIPL